LRRATRPVQGCRHEHLEQHSTIYARTSWTRQEDGSYDPDEVPCSKVLEEETTAWACSDCGIQGWLDEDGFEVWEVTAEIAV
jgi:hypothetical protein